MNDQENELLENDSTVEEDYNGTYTVESDESIADSLLTTLNDFYHSYVVESVNGTFQIFKSFTYGEMVIAFLLMCILFLLLLRFVFEVIR